MWGYGSGWGWGAWVMMGLTMIVFWGLLIAGAIALVRYLGRGRHQHPPVSGAGGSAAEEVLAGRFARGEIDEEEFRQRRALLREPGGR